MIRVRFILLGFSLLLALGAAALVWRSSGLEDSDATAAGEHAQIGGHFRLVDQNGHARTDRDFRGRWLIVYFGYTYCPDECPTTLQKIADALRALGPQADTIEPVFITLDPGRDHPSTLRKYLAAFGPEFVGLTGSPAQIASVARVYHVYYVKQPLPGGGYSVDHANIICLMAPDGRFVSTLDASGGAPALAKALRAHL